MFLKQDKGSDCGSTFQIKYPDILNYLKLWSDKSGSWKCLCSMAVLMSANVGQNPSPKQTQLQHQDITRLYVIIVCKRKTWTAALDTFICTLNLDQLCLRIICFSGDRNRYYLCQKYFFQKKLLFWKKSFMDKQQTSKYVTIEYNVVSWCMKFHQNQKKIKTSRVITMTLYLS